MARSTAESAPEPSGAAADGGVWRGAALVPGRYALDARSLAAFRVGVAVVHLWSLVEAWESLETLASGDGVFSGAKIEYGPDGWAARVPRFRSDAAWARLLWGASLVATLCLGLGLQTRAATVAVWASVVSAIAHRPMTHAGPDELLAGLLCWGALLPLGRVWSVDAWRRSGAAGGREAPRLDVVGAPAWALRAQVVVLYGTSAFVKLFAEGSDWPSGEALGAALRCPATYATATGHALGARAPPWLLRASSWLALGIQACGALAVAVGGAPGDVALLALAAEHVAIRAAKGCESLNLEGPYLGQFPLVSADLKASDHLSSRSRKMDASSETCHRSHSN